MKVLSIRNLKKKFGDYLVFDNISFDVEEGSIFGFLGQNGAGKTTTMKMILGLIPSDGGEVTVMGEKVKFGYTSTNRYIGYLPDVPEFYTYLTAKEYLFLCADMIHMDTAIKKEKIVELLSLVGLNDVKKRIGSYSRGMKQRLGIAQALLGEPKLLICDEPTSALDPIGRKEILDILLKVKEKTTVLFSTHILSDVERICDHVAVLHKGELVINAQLNELKNQRRQNKIYLEFALKETMSAFLKLPNIATLNYTTNEDTLSVEFISEELETTQSVIHQAISEHKIYPTKVEVGEPTLESLFLEVVK